ncbi:hypothetical protein NX059_006624 [Plenodomus lindquistii]|nr:hypothetical protein NX059_006624 [Plenodomus lindquistii]
MYWDGGVALPSPLWQRIGISCPKPPTTFFPQAARPRQRDRKYSHTLTFAPTTPKMAPIQQEPPSLLYKERIAQYVSLSPACLATPHPAICASIFSPLLLSYFPPARGIVLAYSNVSLSASPPSPRSKSASSKPEKSHSKPTPPQADQESDLSATDSETESQGPAKQQLLLKHVDEYSSPFLWATATFLIFRPQRNASLQGTITHQSRTHITLSYLNTFPVSVLAAHLPKTWSWHVEAANKMKKGWDGRIADEGGWWVVEGEEDGGKVENGRSVEVRIRDWEGRMDGKGKGKGFLRIEGSLVSVEEEAERREKGKGRA